MNEMHFETALQSSSPDTPQLTELVVDAVAEAEGVSPLDLTPPLASAIDADALDSLFHVGSAGTVEFAYLGYRVRISDDGDVDVAETDD